MVRDMRIKNLRHARWVITTGHYALGPVMAFACAERIAGTLAGYAWVALVALAMTPPALALLAHHTGVCARGRCGQMITDPEGEAERFGWWLWWCHNTFRSRATWAVLGTWFAFTFAWPVPLLTIPPTLVMLWGVLRALRVHSQLRPWCQWCRDQGDDGDEPGEDTPPEGGLARPVPRETAWFHREDWA